MILILTRSRTENRRFPVVDRVYERETAGTEAGPACATGTRVQPRARALKDSGVLRIKVIAEKTDIRRIFSDITTSDFR